MQSKMAIKKDNPKWQSKMDNLKGQSKMAI
jgi:hypothetical protein